MKRFFTRAYWSLEFYEDWTQLLGGCNWYTFRLAQMEFEKDKISGVYEFTFFLFGFGFIVSYCYEDTEHMAEMHSRVAEFLEKIDAESVK